MAAFFGQTWPLDIKDIKVLIIAFCDKTSSKWSLYPINNDTQSNETEQGPKQSAAVCVIGFIAHLKSKS